MAQFEQSRATTDSRAAADAAHGRSVPDGAVAERTGVLPTVAVVTVLAIAAGAWFFYEQGQRYGTLGEAPQPPSTLDIGDVGSTPIAAHDGNTRATTTFEQSPAYGNPDIVVTVHPTVAQLQDSAPPPRTKTKTMLAHATKPANAPALAPSAPRSDRAVVLASRPQPTYPSQALRAREQGTVLVMAQVDVNGSVSAAHVVKRSGSTTLDRAAPNEVRRWKFSPALHGGQPIVASVEVPVSYRLEQ
jgi:TonB family protein